MEELTDRLHSLLIHLLRRTAANDAAAGLSPARLSALSVIHFGGATTLGQLAAAERVSAPTMSRIVAALERDGYVRRSGDTNDRRRTVLTSTAAGKRALDRARKHRLEFLRDRIGALND